MPHAMRVDRLQALAVLQKGLAEREACQLRDRRKSLEQSLRYAEERLVGSQKAIINEKAAIKRMKAQLAGRLPLPKRDFDDSLLAPHKRLISLLELSSDKTIKLSADDMALLGCNL